MIHSSNHTCSVCHTESRIDPCAQCAWEAANPTTDPLAMGVPVPAPAPRTQFLPGDLVQVRTGDRGTPTEWSGPAKVLWGGNGLSVGWCTDQGVLTGGGSYPGPQDVRRLWALPPSPTPVPSAADLDLQMDMHMDELSSCIQLSAGAQADIPTLHALASTLMEDPDAMAHWVAILAGYQV